MMRRMTALRTPSTDRRELTGSLLSLGLLLPGWRIRG
jgi:hypothetical protein